MKLIAIHSNKMMAYLTLRRFNLIKIEKDIKNYSRKIYLFNDTEELRNAMFKFKYDKDFHELANKLSNEIRKE